MIDDRRVADLISEFGDLALFSLDAEGVCTRWEAVSSNMKALTRRELVGRCFEEFLPEEQRELRTFWQELECAAEQGRSEGEGWRVRKDGTRRWMRHTLFPDRDDEGRVTGYLGIVSDATREKDSSNALAANEEQLRQLVEGLQDHAIHGLDPEGRVSSWNAGAERMTGYRAEEIVGRHCSCFYSDEDREIGRPALALKSALEDGRYECDGWRVRKDGTRFRAHILIQPVFDGDKRLVGYTKLVRDVTAEATVAEELAEAHEALDRSEKLRSLGELTGGIAHDFNNLLTVVRGSAELLQNAELPEHKRARHIEAIVETADRAAELTGQLLSFGRRQALQPKPTDINGVIAEITEMLRRTLGLRVAVLKAPQPGLWQVEVDPQQLHNLILNAALNARDAMDGVGTLTIATRNVTGAQGEEVRLSISDTGRGMAPEVKERA
ncbi:MAG: PAS domain S-box protein, partial [Parasphingopyxis sp.]